ncbi:hypothetical protein Tco_1359902 [Tanacetum coccineum]
MSTYLKHMGGYKHKQLMGKSFDEIQKLFDKEMKRSNKRASTRISKETKTWDDKETDEHEEVEADDTAELKKHLVIKKDDDIAIDAIPLATKPPMIKLEDSRRMKHKVRDGLWGLKRTFKDSYYCSVFAAGYKDITAAELQLLEDYAVKRIKNGIKR